MYFDIKKQTVLVICDPNGVTLKENNKNIYAQHNIFVLSYTTAKRFLQESFQEKIYIIIDKKYYFSP